MADSYSMALAARRGKGMDATQMIYGDQDSDLSIGRGLAAGQGDMNALGMTDPAHPAANADVGIVGMPPDVKNAGADLKTPSDMEAHTRVPGESSEAPLPLSQSEVGESHGALSNQIRDHVTGGASEREYDELKGLKPRSLGERAKMEALKSQFPGAAK